MIVTDFHDKLCVVTETRRTMQQQRQQESQPCRLMLANSFVGNTFTIQSEWLLFACVDVQIIQQKYIKLWQTKLLLELEIPCLCTTRFTRNCSLTFVGMVVTVSASGLVWFSVNWSVWWIFHQNHWKSVKIRENSSKKWKKVKKFKT